MSKLFEYNFFLQTLTNEPGVYRMYNSSGIIIYVGKAKKLKQRLSSYFSKNLKNLKISRLVENIAKIDITVTHTETEALLLEHNYIKFYQPYYNVLLCDDKTYPYIFLSSDEYPRISMYRGIIKKNKGHYFGPFPSVTIVKETLFLLQKLFPLRQCENIFFKHRSRPCLQYQINRCFGPCIHKLISKKEYNQQVKYVHLFLLGKNQKVINELIKKMNTMSNKLEFEKAKKYRDQIKLLKTVMEQQYVVGNIKDSDIISIAYKLGIACIQVLFIRYGKLLGSRSYYPKIPFNTELNEIMQTFLGQYYLHNSKNRSLPTEIILDCLLPEKKILANLLTNITGRTIKIQIKPQGIKGKFLKLAYTNAMNGLNIKLLQQSNIHKRIISLKKILNIEHINRLECFDISHISGQQTIASCIVFDSKGPLRSQYRYYNINNIDPGNDYAAMNQVLMRYYSNFFKKKTLPNIIFIDGGKGQLTQAISVFKKLNIDYNLNNIKIIAIAKNKSKTGSETLYLEPYGNGLSLSFDSPALHLIQNIRNESHNYAIKQHRKLRIKIQSMSILESIKGIGPKRKQKLLKYIGGLHELRNASINEIMKVPHISYELAQKIFNLFH